LLSLAVHASAENSVCIGGDLDHLNAAQKAICQATANQIRSEAVKFNAPGDWHFFVLCTETDWKVYTTFSKRNPMSLASLGADTDLEQHRTFFNGEHLHAANALGLDKIVAHEVASALLKSTDEKAIQTQVAVWLPDTATSIRTLMASR